MAVAPAGVYMNSRSLAVVCQYGPSCSKLTMSLVKELLKFQTCCMQIFLLKNVRNFCTAKVPYILSAKNRSIVNSVSTKRLNESLTNDPVELTMF